MKSEHTIKDKLREYKFRYDKGEIKDEVYDEVIAVLNWIVKKEDMDIPFEDIWAIYAKKDFSGQKGPRFTAKKQARAYWSKMSSSGRAYAIKYADKFIRNKPFEGYQAPALLRYLRNERWEEVMDTEETMIDSNPNTVDLVSMQEKLWNDHK